MGRFIDQILIPFFYFLDEMIQRHMTDREILDVLGEHLGPAAIENIEMQRYHDGTCQFDVLAGSRLAAKQIMTQSLVILGEYVLNPQLQQFLAEVHGVYLDQREFLKMVLISSEWGTGIIDTLIRPLTPEMKQRMQAKQGAPDPKAAAQMARDQAKFQADSALEDQKTQNRITRDVTVDSFRKMGEDVAVTGEATGPGFGAGEGGQ